MNGRSSEAVRTGEQWRTRGRRNGRFRKSSSRGPHQRANASQALRARSRTDLLVCAACPLAVQVLQYPTQRRNSTGRRPPAASGVRDGSGNARFLRVRAVHAHGQRRAGAWGSGRRPARSARDARRRGCETFWVGGGHHGSDNPFDRAARRGGVRRGRLGILAVAPVTLALSDLPPGQPATVP